MTDYPQNFGLLKLIKIYDIIRVLPYVGAAAQILIEVSAGESGTVDADYNGTQIRNCILTLGCRITGGRRASGVRPPCAKESATPPTPASRKLRRVIAILHTPVGKRDRPDTLCPSRSEVLTPIRKNHEISRNGLKSDHADDPCVGA